MNFITLFEQVILHIEEKTDKLCLIVPPDSEADAYYLTLKNQESIEDNNRILTGFEMVVYAHCGREKGLCTEMIKNFFNAMATFEIDGMVASSPRGMGHIKKEGTRNQAEFGYYIELCEGVKTKN